MKAVIWARRFVQAAFLLLFLFLFLQTESKGADELGYPVRLFLDFDPLLSLSTLLAAHSVPRAFLLSLVLVVLTAFLGRVFCGWVCPLGTLNQAVGSLRRWPFRHASRGWFRIKYYLLAGLLGAAALSAQWTGFFDPLCLLVRSLSLGVHPAANHAGNAVLDFAYGITGGGSAADFLHAGFRWTFLSLREPHFRQAALLGFLFAGVLALNLVERRFWCRYLCPLGALLGLISRWAFLKRTVSEGCTSCGICDHDCQGAAGAGSTARWKPSECMACFNCGDACPTSSVAFTARVEKGGPPPDLSRRRILASLAVGAAVVPVTRAVPAFRPLHPEPLLIRPPGAREEPEFLERCVKCGECMKVCITGGLQPALLEAGIEGLWSPVLVPRIGYCEYRCTLCGQVCPTGAIRRLSEGEKARVRIGLATIDPGRCLPFAHATSCIVCEEVCPTPTKAIWFEEAPSLRRDGTSVQLKRPRVDLELCIGCGICETKCPVMGTPAIRVTSLGESRSPENQLLLEEAISPYN